MAPRRDDPASHSWRARLLEQLRPSQLIPNLTAGLVVSVIVVIVSVSLGTLIFTNELAPHLASGLGLMLFSGIVITAFVSLTSSYPGMIAYPQERVAPILAVLVAAIAAQLSATASSETLFHTTVAVIAVTSLVSALFLWLLGVLHFGAFVRFIPFPVIGGFLAGTGYLLVKGSLGVMTGLHIDAEHAHQLLEPAQLAKWASGVAFGVVLVTVSHRFKQSFVLPGLLFGGVGVFYLVITALAVTPDAARSDGWLLGPFPGGGSWRPLTVEAFAGADWGAILGQAGNIGSILLISAISVLLNSAALELLVKRDIDLNRELRVAGIGNLLVGMGAGPVGFHTLSVSRLVHGMHVRSRMVGVIAAIACALTLFLGFGALTYLPRLVLGGLLFFLGMHFLLDWVVGGWTRLTRADYSVVMLILAVVATFGYLQGVVVGILACVVLFLVSYSRVTVVKHALTGSHQSSNVDRPMRQLRCLHDDGEQIVILRLQGFIFFGTAHGLLERVRARADGAVPMRFLVLDFREVTGIDSSSVMSFTRILQLAEQRGFVLVVAQLAADVRRLLAREGFDRADARCLRILDDLDHALEWCEDQVLAAAGLSVGDDLSLAEELRHELGNNVDLGALLGYFERQELEPGHRVIEQGDASDSLFLIERGCLTAQLERPGKAIRLRTMITGAVVGELGMILGGPRSASVVADGPATVLRLTADALQRMQTEAPELAQLFQRFITRGVAGRLARKDKAIQLLLG